MQVSTTGGSGTFLARASDGGRWWVKPQNSPQGPKVTATEFIAGKLGAILDAPVCRVTVLRIPDELAGWEFRPGLHIEAGYACGSEHVEGAVEERALLYRDRDDNARRHAGVFGFYDWCWGGDDQWLYSAVDDKKLFSHDHGWYFPETGPDWDDASLSSRVGDRHPITSTEKGLSAAELRRIAARLRSLTRSEIRDVLMTVPVSWAVTDADLEGLGYFVEARCESVADRLEQLAVTV
jgi:hypothetical protein